ncbi:uncharacterized protein DDB_G0286591-like isoform X2 [Chelonus insularis]|nr:uncharacterized protein DDB_G0286591-like isoform X2 [Chelonus insularis]XP_034937185.1 uncharacterized protein DDB_G0286591-like isoform X2 [Chelonus insularis]
MVLLNCLGRLPIIKLASTITASFVKTKLFKMGSVQRHTNLQLNMMFVIIGFLSFFSSIGITSCAPVENENRRKPLSEQLKTEGVGNPSELAWQAWLLIDNDKRNSNGENLDSASLLRRITPKSIFIAPPLQACAEGYQPDAMNRCVKDININQEAHIDFLLQRLNAMYANFGNLPPPPPPPPKSDTSSASSGPFQVHIPLFVDTDHKETTKKENTKNSEKKPSLSKEENTEKESERPDDKKEAVLTIYEDVKNESTGIEQLIPVMEFVEEIDSNFSDILDFKSQTVYDKVSNKSENDNNNNNNNNKTENIGETIENKVNNTDQISNSSGDSIHPTLFLLLPPTNSSIANLTDDIKINNNVSLKRVEINFERKNNESVNEDIIRIKFPLTTTEPSTTLPPIKLILNVSESLENSTEVETEVYDDGNEYTTESSTGYTTEKEDVFQDQTEEYEESTENEDEILKHSEAGSMVTYSPTKFPHIKTTFVENKENESKISGEVTVSKDFIRETTLVGLNIDKINKDINNNNKNIDKNINNNEKKISNNKNDLEKNPDDNKYQDKLSTVEATTPWSTTLHETTTEESTGRLTTFPIPTVNQVSLMDNSPGVLSIEEAMEKESMSPKTPTIRSSMTPDIIPPQNTSEVEIFSKILNSKPSETMTASSSNTAEMFMPQKSIDTDVQQKPSKPVFNLQQMAFKFPSTSVEQMNAYNYYAGPQAYSNYRYPVQNNNRFVLKPANSQKSDSVKNFDLKRKDYANYQSPAFYPIRNRDHVKFPTFTQPQTQPNYVRFPSQQANSIHTSNDFKEKNYQHQYSQPAYHLLMKPPYWPVASNYRTNRQQSPQRVVSGYQNDRKKQDRSSSVLGFWTRMPLFQDPTFVQQQQKQQQQQSNPLDKNDSLEIDPRINAARRISYYKELSPPNGTRSYARSTPVRR